MRKFYDKFLEQIPDSFTQLLISHTTLKRDFFLETECTRNRFIFTCLSYHSGGSFLKKQGAVSPELILGDGLANSRAELRYLSVYLDLFHLLT